MDELRILASEASWLTLVVVFFIFEGAWDGFHARVMRTFKLNPRGVSATFATLVGLTFLVLPQVYILVVLVGRIFGQEWY